LADKEIDRTLPCRDDLWVKNEKVDTKWFKTRHHHGDQPEQETSQPENLGAFAYYIEILGILSKIHQFLKQPVDISALSDVEQWQFRYKELDNELTQWKFSLPSEFGNMSRLYQPGIGKNISCTDRPSLRHRTAPLRGATLPSRTLPPWASLSSTMGCCLS